MSMLLLVPAVCLMTLLGSFGALFFKRATRGTGGLMGLLRSPSLYGGALFYLAGSVMNILLLRVMEYTVIYPMTALTYIWSLIVSRIAFHEPIGPMKIGAILCILAGVALISL